MPVKESSDELNPPVVTTGVLIARPARKRSAGDYLALAIATCGVGYMPLAPGTWGSLLGIVIFKFWHFLMLRFVFAHGGDDSSIPAGIGPLLTLFTMALVFVITLIGIWAATRVEKISGRKDPGIVVIDEVAGQFITLSFLSYFDSNKWPLILAGFLLFRIFDIWKPYPIRRLEALESGLGIMADDVLAGAYAAMVLSLVTAIYLFWRY
ncbi:MAG TPA: phosphatidylglycerophosphatase A [Pyrinomonadaceae bacterium]|jgi:phosphatidylglycerophosphatase A